MNKITTILMVLVLSVISISAFSQTEQDGKIKIEITKEIDGEKRTFKGEYNSTEEMRADPNYQEFAGDDSGFNMWFDGDDDVLLHLDQLRANNNSSFKFFDDEDNDGRNGFFFKHFDDDGDGVFFKHFDGDSINSFFDMYINDRDMKEYKKKLEELGIQLDVLVDKFNHGNSNRTSIITMKKVKITDVEDEFGKQGKVTESNKLALEDLSFFPNPSSNGRFKVRFGMIEEGELNIRVSNLDGKEIFNRYFERFGGTYSEMIDLSDQKDGIYLLEISSGKRRLTKKIVIN